MKLRIMTLLLVSFMFGSADSVLAEDLSVPEARVQIREAWNKVNTLSATSKQSYVKDMRSADLSSIMQGTYYLMKKDGRVLVRQDISSASSLDYKEHGLSTATGNESTTISDGEYQYTIATADTGTAVKKFKQSPMLCIGGLSSMQVIFERYEVSRAADSTIDGQEVFVFEAIARTKRPRRAVVAISKKYGIMLKRDSYDHTGTLRSSLSYHDIKVNEDIDPQKFVFVKPPNIPMEDFSK